MMAARLRSDQFDPLRDPRRGGHTAAMRFLLLAALLGRSVGAAEAPDSSRLEGGRARIDASIKKAGPRHPWAGRYYKGDGLGMNESLLLSPAGEFSFENHGCTSFPPEEQGKFREEKGLFHFEGAESEAMSGSRLRLVRWGERAYLIPDERLIAFANDVNQGLEPRYRAHGFHFMRRDGDEIPLASGRPRVPKAVEPYLLDRAVDSVIVSVGASIELSSSSHREGKLETSIEVDAGSEAGLLPGMELMLRGGMNGDATISRVDARSSTALLVSTAPPQAGWRLSTRFDWRRELAPADQPYRVRVMKATGRKHPPYKGSFAMLDHLVPFEDAPRFGFEVSEVARVEVGAVSAGLSSFSKLWEVLGPLGANAFVLDHGVPREAPGPWSHVITAVGYRIEFEGRPVPHEAVATNLRVADFDNTWERTRARILMKRNKYAREELRLEHEVTLELLHLTERQWSDAYTLKFDDLSPGQQAAVRKSSGVTYPYVMLHELLYSSLSHWTKTRDAEVRSRLEKLGKSDPKGFGEYEALRAVAHPIDAD